MAEEDGIAAELVDDGKSGCTHYRRKCKLVVSFTCFQVLFAIIFKSWRAWFNYRAFNCI